EASQEHLQAMGGVWTPPPRPTSPGGATPSPTSPSNATPSPTSPSSATPSPTSPSSATPSPTSSAQPQATTTDVVRTLTELTEDPGVLAQDVWSAQTATLIASITLYRDGALHRLRAALD